MKVMCIAGTYQGHGPQIPFGTICQVKVIVEGLDGTFYMFDYSGWAYDSIGFVPLSKIDERKIARMRKKKRSWWRRLAERVDVLIWC